MASVFLSYDHEDQDRASLLARALEARGHSVWWDRHIDAGAEYNDEIQSAVERAQAVVVLWSERSIRSPWVRDEAAEGRDHRKLVPVIIDDVKPPMGFRQFQSIDLSDWRGGKRMTRLPDVLRAIERLAGNAVEVPQKAARPSRPPARPGRMTSRRALMIGGGATAVGLAGTTIWFAASKRVDPRVEAVIADSKEALRVGRIDRATTSALERAVAIQPDNPRALGLLALFRSLLMHDVEPSQVQGLVDSSQRAAERALAINPREPNALLAMFELQGSTLDWFTRDQHLRQIMAIDPGAVDAMAELALLTQASGYCYESWLWNERAVKLRPLSLNYLGKRALKLWIVGRTAEADKVSDQIRALNPTSGWAWYVRFLIYAFTGRAAAAQEMLDHALEPSEGFERCWRPALTALALPTPTNVTKAAQASIEAAERQSELAGDAVQILGTLGDLDNAFAIAEGVLLSRGRVIRREQQGSIEAVHDASARIGTQWLFTPPVDRMRGDPRWLPLCEGIGLTEYWRRRGLKPDYQRNPTRAAFHPA